MTEFCIFSMQEAARVPFVASLRTLVNHRDSLTTAHLSMPKRNGLRIGLMHRRSQMSREGNDE